MICSESAARAAFSFSGGDVFVGEAKFLRAEQQRHRRGRELAADQARAIFQPAQRVLQLAMADGSGSDHQAAVGHGIADVRKLFRRGEHRSRVDRGARFAECDLVRIHNSQAREAEVGHGACGGADVQRVSRRDEHHAKLPSQKKICS